MPGLVQDQQCATCRRNHRESRLRVLGFDDVTDEQRARNTALNVALLDWPKE
jgi:hypothetical protein